MEKKFVKHEKGDDITPFEGNEKLNLNLFFASNVPGSFLLFVNGFQDANKNKFKLSFSLPSNGVISSPFSCLTNFFSKKHEGNPMF